MKKIDESQITYLNIDNVDWQINLINIFLQNKRAVVEVNDNCYITYDSFMNYIMYGQNLYKTKEEVYYYQKHLSKKEKSEWQTTLIDLQRWRHLYSNNDKIINYIRSIKPKTVYIIGELSEELYNYINVYGNEFETIILPNTYESIANFASQQNAILIDTNGLPQHFKNECFKNVTATISSSSQMIDISELCNEAEVYYFITEILTNANYDVTLFEFPDNDQFTNLTAEEQQRIKSNANYIYYLSEADNNPKIKELIKRVMGDLFEEDYLRKEGLSPGTILKNGICRLGDSDNEFCRSINGIRYTTDQDSDYTFSINIFGPCMVYGALVDDKHTISSYLQRKINQESKDYNVNNYGLRAMDLPEQIRIADSANLRFGDKLIFVISSSEKQKLSQYGYDKTISLLPVFNNNDLHDYFLDKPVHCNHIANSHIANYIYEQIKEKLLDQNSHNKSLAHPIEKKIKRNIFSNNNYLEEYLKMLRELEVHDGPNGAILMNCNPFTYGHYKLIEYASKEVEQLFVIVVQEDKSIFKFEDRFEMVKEGCKDFSNVIVIPSGKIFGSSMIFPEYFNRSSKTEISLDLTIDREIFADYIAPTLNIKKRFVGEEKNDPITAAYNRDLKNNLPLYGIEVIEIPRFVDKSNKSISAKNVRTALEEGDLNAVSELVPPTTMAILQRYNNTGNQSGIKILKK